VIEWLHDKDNTLIYQYSKDGSTPLHTAALGGNIKSFECIYESEIEVNLENSIEPTERTIADLTCEEVRDRSPQCQKLKKYCQAPKYVAKMKQNCKSTCGFCRKTCKDANQFACTAERFRCFSDPEFAKKVCPATCGLCEE